MASDVWFTTGDLIEYTRPMKGQPALPDEMTVRAIVFGLEVTVDSRTGEPKTSVQLYEGAEAPLTEPVRQQTTDGRADAYISEGAILRERELIALKLDYVLSLEPTVIRRGNSPRSLDPFVVGEVPYDGDP